MSVVFSSVASVQPSALSSFFVCSSSSRQSYIGICVLVHSMVYVTHLNAFGMVFSAKAYNTIFESLNT